MEGDLGGPGLDFYRFWKDFGAAIWTFLANFGTTIVFFGMRVCRSRFLKISGCESGCLGLQNQAFVRKVLQKPAFHICRDYVDFGVIFTWFSMALGPILMTFGGLGAGLKFTGFSGLPWGTPRSWQCARSVLIWLLSGPHCHPPNSFQQQFNMQNTS